MFKWLAIASYVWWPKAAASGTFSSTIHRVLRHSTLHTHCHCPPNRQHNSAIPFLLRFARPLVDRNRCLCLLVNLVPRPTFPNLKWLPCHCTTVMSLLCSIPLRKTQKKIYSTLLNSFVHWFIPPIYRSIHPSIHNCYQQSVSNCAHLVGGRCDSDIYLAQSDCRSPSRSRDVDPPLSQFCSHFSHQIPILFSYSYV